MKNKIKNLFKILVVTAGCLMFASFSPSLDGRAVVVDDGVFPQGLFAKTVGYLPGDIISVTNIAGDATVDLLVIGALDPSEGVAIMLSPEAAQAMGIEKGSNNIVKITKRSGQEERVYGNAVISKSATDFDDYDDGSFESIGAEENSEAFEEPAVDENMASEEFKEEETEEFTEPAPEAEESFDEAIPEETEAAEETEEEAFAEEEAFDDAEEYEEYTDEAELEEETEEAFEEEPAETEEEYAEEAYEDEPLSEQPVEEEYEAFEDEELPATEESPEEYVEETAEPEEEAAEEDFAEEFDDEMPAEEEEAPSEEAFAADELDELPVEEEKEEVPAEEEETEETPAEESFEESFEDEAPAEESFEEEALTEEPLAEEAFEDEKPEELPEELPEEEAFEEESPDELTETEEYEAIVLVPADSNPPEPAEDEVEDVVSEDELEELGDDTVFNLTPLEGSSAGSAGASAGAAGSVAESVVEAVAEPVETAPVPVTEKTTSYDKYIVPSLNQLESGKYYIQIAVYASDENILEVINKYGNNYPITIVPMAGGKSKQVLIGPVTMDEYKVVLERFKSYGFKDAFLRKVR